MASSYQTSSYHTSSTGYSTAYDTERAYDLIANSEEGRYWTSVEKHWASSMKWTAIHSIAISVYEAARGFDFTG